METLAFGVKVIEIGAGNVTLLPIIVEERTGSIIWTADEPKVLTIGEALAGSAPMYEEENERGKGGENE